MTATDIQSLETAWRTAYPRQTNGGIVGIAGFGYQFHTMLRDAVQAWIKDSSSTAPASETLSDLTQGVAGHWTITQVNRTGTSGSLQKALAELWTIDAVARHETPDLVSSLHYEVRCARWELKDAHGTIDRWMPKDPSVDSDASLNGFRSRISISCDPHPIDDLVAILANKAHAQDPLEWIHKWVGELVQAANESQDALRNIGTRLYNSLTSLKENNPQQQLPQGIRILATNVVEPDCIEKGHHLVGEHDEVNLH